MRPLPSGLSQVLQSSRKRRGGAAGTSSTCEVSYKDMYKICIKTFPFVLSSQRAVEVMCFVPKRCNDMMNVGRLQGFEVRFFFSPRKLTFISGVARFTDSVRTYCTCCFRVKSQLRGSCFSRIPSPSVSRKRASCPDPGRGGSSSSSSWLSSVSQLTRKRASCCRVTLSKTASR